MCKIAIIALSLLSIPFFVKAQVPELDEKVFELNATVYDSAATSGYYFLCNTSNLIITDRFGKTIYYKPGKQLSNFALHSNGVMSYSEHLKFYLMDSTFKIIDSLKCKNLPITNYHDLRILPNGHFLMIGTDSVSMDLSTYPFWKEKSDQKKGIVRYTVVQEQDARKNVVFEWRAIDHYAIDDVDTFFLPRFPLVDWTHPDAVEMDNDGNILLSNRNFNEITKINHTDGSIMWRFGGKHNEFKFVNCPVPFFGQHDIRRIANGHITLFDNGDHTLPHGARALEFELDEINKIATLKWSYLLDSTLYSTRQGNVQRLGNSNTLINYGNTSGNPDNPITCVVVNNAGSKILQLENMHSYRVFNYPSLPWTLNRPLIKMYESKGVTYLDAGAGYTSYEWNTGDSTRTIPVTKASSYHVFLPDGHGGYISSEKFPVTDIAHSGDILPKEQNKKK